MKERQKGKDTKMLKYIVGIPWYWFRALSWLVKLLIVWYLASLVAAIMTSSAWAAYSGVACCLVSLGAVVLKEVRKMIQRAKESQE